MTDGFSAGWLALREPYDAAARSAELARAFLDALPPRPTIADLGAGRGANARYLDAMAADGPAWRLIDRDAALLRRADGLRRAPVRTCRDIATDALELGDADAVTASALLDLVSEAWFTRFVRGLPRVPLLFALTADGAVRWCPADADDPAIMTAFEVDMRRDKGFGPAMGTAAPRLIEPCLALAGFRVRTAKTDWRLGAEDGALLSALIDQFAAVAGCSDGTAAAWRERRQRAVTAGRLHLTVGHIDILALP